ncbi:MAG: hypothetical protein P8O68_05925, partial [Gammaproteobacteria bacterium]|nr:hypothetical protein [Gammaproteobacteria bacterium]
IYNNIINKYAGDNSKPIDSTLLPDGFNILQDTKISGKNKNLIKDKSPNKVNTIGTFMEPHSCSDNKEFLSACIMVTYPNFTFPLRIK